MDVAISQGGTHTKDALEGTGRNKKGAPLVPGGVWSSEDPYFPCQASKVRDPSSLRFVLSAQTVAFCDSTSGNYRHSSGGDGGGGGHRGCCSLYRCCQDADAWPGKCLRPLDMGGG